MEKISLESLLIRRSTSIKHLGDPAPTADQIETMLTIAARVPDHNKLAPWWFITFMGQARHDFGKVLRDSYRLEDPDAAPAKLDLESERFLRAPLVVAVISRIKEGKAPQWEQILSAGAACYNLCLAANAMGFGYNWVTEWTAYNEGVRNALKLDDRDHIAGFVYIGTAREPQAERERPSLPQITNAWHDGYIPHKGDEYGKAGLGIPNAGFTIKN